MEQLTADQIGDSMADIVMGQQSAPAEPQHEPEEQTVTSSGEGEVAVTEAQQPDPETVEIDPDAEIFEMELEENGQKIAKKLSLKEFQKGYLRQSDYTRKTQELARQRAEVQESTRQARLEAAKQFTEKLDLVQAAFAKAVAPELAGVDWNKLAAEDPFQYVQLSHRQRQISEALQTIESEKAKAQELSKTEEQQRKLERWNKTLDQLKSDIPDWGQPVAHKIAKAAREVGATDDQINALDEAWLIKLAHKAALYDELKNVPVEKRVAVVPKVLKPGQKVQGNRQSDLEKSWRKGGGKVNAEGADIFAKYV